MDHGLENLIYTYARFPARLDGILRGDGEDVLDLLGHSVDVSAGQVDFVDHRNDLEPLSIGQLGIGQGLGFDPL